MYRSIQQIIRNFVAGMGESEGEVVKKFKKVPKIKPSRQESDVKTVSNRTDYMKNYMQDYRDDGKDYQKVPDKVKEYRREQKKKTEKKSNVGINTSTPHYTNN